MLWTAFWITVKCLCTAALKWSLENLLLKQIGGEYYNIIVDNFDLTPILEVA
jgi:hypothetical protein